MVKDNTKIGKTHRLATGKCAPGGKCRLLDIIQMCIRDRKNEALKITGTKANDSNTALNDRQYEIMERFYTACLLYTSRTKQTKK